MPPHGGANVSRSRVLNWLVLLILLVVWLRGCVLRPGTRYPGRRFNDEANATWLDEIWVGEARSEQRVRWLGEQLQAHQIRFAYVHVTQLQDNGQFRPGYGEAASFVRNLHLASSEVKALASVDLPVDERGPFSGAGADLARAETRQVIARFCSWLIRDVGFDGVHLKVHPLSRAETSYRQLIWEVRAAIGPTAILSVATPPIAVLPFGLLGDWETRDYVVTAPLVDHIVVETQYSSLPWEWSFAWWVRWQVVRVTRSLDQSASQARVWFGVPAQDRPSLRHIGRGETIAAGLRGVIAGLNDAETQQDVVGGVAVYAYRDVDAQEWETYDQLWLGREVYD